MFLRTLLLVLFLTSPLASAAAAGVEAPTVTIGEDSCPWDPLQFIDRKFQWLSHCIPRVTPDLPGEASD